MTNEEIKKALEDSRLFIKGVEYTTGIDRNEPVNDNTVAHLYKGPFNKPEAPMCPDGYNREHGFGFSIFRNQENIPTCQACMDRALDGLPPVEPVEKETKWL